MSKHNFAMIAVILIIIACALIPNESTTAFSKSDINYEKAAEKCIGDICSSNESAYVLYLYDETKDLSPECMYGINRALVSCDYIVSFSGQIGVLGKEDIEDKIKAIVLRQIEITHILTDSDFVFEETKKILKQEKSGIEVVNIADEYTKTGL